MYSLSWKLFWIFLQNKKHQLTLLKHIFCSLSHIHQNMILQFGWKGFKYIWNIKKMGGLIYNPHHAMLSTCMLYTVQHALKFTRICKVTKTIIKFTFLFIRNYTSSYLSCIKMKCICVAVNHFGWETVVLV